MVCLVEHSKSELKFVAIHLGASNSEITEDSKRLAQRICKDALLNLDSEKEPSQDTCKNPECLRMVVKPYVQSTAELAAIGIVKMMEDVATLNCGSGSNLNLDGRVECDASMMRNRDSAYAGVGAVSGCRNPIKLVESLICHRSISRPMGLLQPNLIVGSSGCKTWMRKHCPALMCNDSELISPKSLCSYQKYKSLYDAGNRDSLLEQHSEACHPSFDTVGAIAIDGDNNIACATSSGGIALKHKGRLGQASIIGAGCWTEGQVAATTSGAGEILTINLLAKKVCDELRSADLGEGQLMTRVIDAKLSECLRDVVNSPKHEQFHPSQRVVGSLAIFAPRDNEFYLSLAHTSKSMCAAYMVNGHQDATSLDPTNLSTASNLDLIKSSTVRILP